LDHSIAMPIVLAVIACGVATALVPMVGLAAGFGAGFLARVIG
jgi:hypothetical protein